MITKSLWKGSIALPDGLPQAVLENVELLSGTVTNTKPLNSNTNSENALFSDAQLRLQAVVDAAKVPLWLSCGPSFEVQTESEATANFFASIFVQQSSRSHSADPEDGEDAIVTEYQPTQKALVIRIIYNNSPEETEKPNITELVLFGTLATSTPPPESTALNDESQQTPTLPPSLSVYALPLSSRLAKEKKLHAGVKMEPLESGKAKFLAPIIGRKRKADIIFDEYDKKKAYYATLPPGLRRSWHSRSNSFTLPKDENEPATNNINIANGDSQKGLLSRSIGPGGSHEFRRTISDDPRLRRERSQSILTTRFREVAEKNGGRDVSAKPLMRTGSDLGILRRSDSFNISRTQNQTPDVIKSEFSNSTISLAAGSSTTAAAANKFAERNKTTAQKLIMASMRLYGFTRARPGEVKIESEEEEYKTVFHTTLRSLTVSLRKSWNTEVISVTKLKETTEYLMKVFVGGAGLFQGSSDKEEEDREDDNPFRKSTIGRRSDSGRRSVILGRDDTTLVEESLLGDSQADLDASQVIGIDD
ncbi:hypothetical protein H072_5465 [Dactylellina haptotyla CBS 200.50]|uniref:Sld7 C-terminal domain-containing protein n=1 Tax=Dactylellina haptotyla (strain CBS 200.50) TaxID=1284197 RepID=S8ACC4_DACHA|nr:hypothetical protein H072_5465 [Dactylellina haptotyla CBS 200.50]